MEKKKRILDKISDIVLIIACVFMSCVIIFNFTHYKIVVNGNSMNPNVEAYEIGFMNKVNKFSKIERFDIVAVNIDLSGKVSDEDKYYIKRIMGLPGETIDIKNGILYVNDVLVEETFEYIEGTNADGHFELSDNQYLISGDNRKVTVSSLIIKKEQIIAKNGFVYKKYTDASMQKKENIKWRLINE